MQIKDSVALVTGANRGIGRAFVEALLERGASRIYATARDLASLDVVVRLDPNRIRALKLDGGAEVRPSTARHAYMQSIPLSVAGEKTVFVVLRSPVREIGQFNSLVTIDELRFERR